MSHRSKAPFVAFALSLSLAACGGDNQTVLDDAEHEAAAILAVKTHIQQRLDDLDEAVIALEAAAPAPDEDGWSAATDPAAVESMRASWKKARVAYESVEGALAVVFPDLDYTLDARYDAFIEAVPDDNLFDDSGVTGMHAVERILWADSIPAEVIAFESALPSYKAAAFPASYAEAAAFRDQLVARMVADVETMRTQWKGLALDSAAAYYGTLGSMGEQAEKVFKAATGEEESRYARFTLEDMRANVAAAKVTYAAFQPWVTSKEGGEDVDRLITTGFAELEASYADIQGDALPPVPEGWSSDSPTPAMLATPFGELFEVVEKHADTENDASIVAAMSRGATLLGAF